MMCGQTGRELTRQLAQLNVELAAEVALAVAAETIAAKAGEIGAVGGEVQSSRTEALVGWRSPALRRRENGEVGMPPAPVLAPLAAAHAESAAMAVGVAVADAFRGA